jgi:hypothetical protein
MLKKHVCRLLADSGIPEQVMRDMPTPLPLPTSSR